MLDRFRRVSVANPYTIRAAMDAALLPNEKRLSNYRGTASRRYEPADHFRFKSDPTDYRSTIATTHLGSLRVSSITDRRGVTCVTEQSDLAAYCLCLMRRGSVALQSPTHGDPQHTSPTTALIYAGSAGTKFTSSDDNERLTIWIPFEKLRSTLEGLLQRQLPNDIAFAPGIDITQGAGASLRAMVAYMEHELARPDSLLSNHIGTDLFEDLLCHSLLQGLHHNYSDWLQKAENSTDLRSVRRAEDYIHAHLSDSINLTDVARAANCCVRSLQKAFRQTRGTTPMAALRQARLEHARKALAGNDAASVTEIALRFGFGNPGRFARLYYEAFGERPLHTLRR